MYSMEHKRIARLYTVSKRSVVLTLPKTIRDQMHWAAGDTVFVEAVGINQIMLTKIETDMVLPSEALKI